MTNTRDPAGLRERDPEREGLIQDAKDVGLGNDINEVLDIADDTPRGFRPGGFIRNWTQGWFTPSYGQCAWYQRDVAFDLVGTGPDRNKRINIKPVYIRQKFDPATDENQHAIQVSFRDKNGNIVYYYLDDGSVGGSGGVFDEPQRIGFQGNGDKNGMFYFNIDVGFQNNPL